MGDSGRCGDGEKFELAQLCGMNHISLNRLIKGRRKNVSGGTIDKLCEVLEAQPGDFLYYEPRAE